MLVNLHVKNLALMDEVEVDFRDHLNILTGETGAGKSILIGSIQAALGGKVPKDRIREGAEYALIELIFQVEEEAIENALKEKDIYLENQQLVISRKIMQGRNVCRINGEVVTLALLKEISGMLLDLHGQQENITLVNPNRHLQILDQYIGEKAITLREDLAKEYAQYTKLKKEVQELQKDGDRRLRELSFLEYEVKEIENARLQPGEDVLLEQQFKRLQNSQQIAEALSQVHQLTSAGGMENISSLLGAGLKALASVQDFDDGAKSLYEQLSQMDSLLSDFSRELSGYLSDLEFDEEQYDEIRQRFDVVNQLKAKYGNSIEKVLAFAEEKRQELERYSDLEGYKAELMKRFEKQQNKVLTISKELSKLRNVHAQSMAEEITSVLVDLNFLQVEFQLQVEALEEPSALGMDKVVFMISTNPGMPLRPIGEVASGGELSRIMLAIKSVLADVDEVGTLIFDEIDTGVSGRTAQMVAEKLSVIAKKHQVICITHLPQIAAMADTHYLIAKEIDKQNTKTEINMLNEQDSVKELARLLGGAKITDTVINNAAEMKKMAKKVKTYELKQN